MIRRRFHLPEFLAALLTTAALAGCMPSLESSEPPARSYWLDAADAAGPVRVTVHLSVVPGLDTERIQVLEPDQRLNYYAGAYWVENLEPLLESVLDRSLNGPGDQQHAVSLEVSVERFFAVSLGEGGAPDVVLTADYRGVVGIGVHCAFDERVRAGSARLRDIVAAHQALVDDLAGALAGFAARLAEGGDVSC
jgi:hypothetical protein